MKPYFKDMNPWIQSTKFDKSAEYIKTWIPELHPVPAKDVHKWYTRCREPQYKGVAYPCPMVDLEEQREKMMDIYEHTMA
jgi:deoxyribodipyrimidine photo-lyase